MMRPVIAFAGLIGAGKTTAAERLIGRYGFRRIRFAGPLKAMVAALGLSSREIDGDLKEAPCELLGGKTPRQAMQLIGTEWGRNLIDQELWTRAWRRAVDQVPSGIGVVADDCRFPNEVAAIRSASPCSLVVRITRTGTDESAAHVSELQAFPADVTIQNDGSIDYLYARIDDLVGALILGQRPAI